MKKEMLVNAAQPEECRIAIVEDGVLEELYVERASQESHVGNVYKGRIVNVEPSIQAAFVDFGCGRNGFLHVSDIDPAYYRHLLPNKGEAKGRDGRRAWDDEDDGDFDDLDDIGTTTVDVAVVAEPEVVPTDDEVAEREQAEAFVPDVPLVAEPAAVDEPEDDGRPAKRRSRRRGRKKKGEPADAEATGDEPVGEAEASESPCDEPPPYMPSAEHRTTASDDDPFAGFGSGIFDDEPAAPPVITAPPPAAPVAEIAEVDDEEEPADTYAEVEDDAADDEPEAEEEDEVVRGDDEEPRAKRRDRRDGGKGGGPRRGRPGGRDGTGRPKPPIQDIFKRGQEVLVQVIKEGIGTKGPTLTTYLSIAGRYLVLMPGMGRIGVSRKIVDEETRRRLKQILSGMKPPPGIGFIIRTAGSDKNRDELTNDLAYLLRIWQVIAGRAQRQKSPSPLHQESDMITRTIRDTFTADIDTVWIDDPKAFDHAQEFLQAVMPRYANRVRRYDSLEPLFFKYGVEAEIGKIQQKKVPLPQGGSLVIEQTEALVAIDVNSGSFRKENNAEETAYQINLVAAKEIARQLRLRDLGGVVVNDFIDMRDEKHRRGVEKALHDAVKRDRARTKILKTSQFGLIQMTRQRIRPSLKRSVYRECAHCAGGGLVKTPESMAIEVMRLLQLAVNAAVERRMIKCVRVRVHRDVAGYLLNRNRREITHLEEAGNIDVHVHALPEASPEALEFVCLDQHENEVRLLPPAPVERAHRHGRGRDRR